MEKRREEQNKMKVKVITQTETMISEEEYNRIIKFGMELDRNSICRLVHCCNTRALCKKNTCPFYNLEKEMSRLHTHLIQVASECYTPHAPKILTVIKENESNGAE